MIEKNTEAEVQKHTGKAASLIKDAHRDQGAKVIIATVEAALKQVCNLKGVGPATGTLVLSVFQPTMVPFFEDELFFCLHPGHGGKLKYDKAEYKSLLARAMDLLLNKAVQAQALEKTAYVLMHSDKLDDRTKEQLKQCVKGPVADIKAENATAEAEENLPKSEACADKHVLVTKETKLVQGRRKADRQEEEREEDATLRRSKRRKV